MLAGAHTPTKGEGSWGMGGVQANLSEQVGGGGLRVGVICSEAWTGGLGTADPRKIRWPRKRMHGGNGHVTRGNKKGVRRNQRAGLGGKRVATGPKGQEERDWTGQRGRDGVLGRGLCRRGRGWEEKGMNGRESSQGGGRGEGGRGGLRGGGAVPSVCC